MSIGIVAKLRVHAGREAEFEQYFAGQAEAVRANEPGNELYRLFRSRAEAGAYLIMEIYRDEAALQAHMSSEHLRAGRPTSKALLAGPLEFELFDAVV